MIINRATCERAPIFFVYGAEGRGKTTLACKFPSPVALLLERGVPRGVSIDAIDDVNTFQKVLGALRELYETPGDYQTVVIDTIDALEPMLLADVCQKHNWKTIEQPSYGKGWFAADDGWRHFLRAITAIRDKYNTTICLVGHSTIERIDDPRAPTYTSYQPKLHKRAKHLVLDGCDIVGFLDTDLRTVNDDGGFRERTRAVGTNARMLFLEGTPAFAAKNRFGMPPKMPIPLDFNIGELTAFWQNERTVP